jgi:microcystin-dependent protein
MANVIISPNMTLPVPIVGIDIGPQWATDLNSCLGAIDSHNHSSGQGVQVTPAGLNISSDLSFLLNNATNLRSVRFAPQTSALILPGDIACIYVVGNELFYNDVAGNRFPLTHNGSVVGTSGSIQNLVAPASAIYNSGTQTIVFQSAAATAANLDAGFIILRNSGPSSDGLTLQAPTLTTNYSITLPQLPVSSGALVTISNTGVEGTTQPDGTTIQNSGGVLSVVNGSIGPTQLAVGIGLCPPGSIMPYGGPSAPTGWLFCDGSSLLRASFTNLFAAIGTAYGTADGTHFNIPMGEGFFLRGVNHGSGNDPDAAGRTANNPGGNTGDNVGSQQVDQFLSHAHNIALFDTANSAAGVQAAGSPSFGTGTTLAAGGSETRPKNIYVNFIIKT